jgi:hypothetical protein
MAAATLTSADRREQVLARLLAAAAHLGADPAVLVMLGVALTLLATGAACRHARFHRRADDADLGRSLASHEAAGDVADVGAVQAAANAPDHLLNIPLAEIGVGAAGTGSGAIGTGLDTADDRVEIAAGRLRMRLEHLSNGHFVSFLAPAGDRRRDRPRVAGITVEPTTATLLVGPAGS